MALSRVGGGIALSESPVSGDLGANASIGMGLDSGVYLGCLALAVTCVARDAIHRGNGGAGAFQVLRVGIGVLRNVPAPAVTPATDESVVERLEHRGAHVHGNRFLALPGAQASLLHKFLGIVSISRQTKRKAVQPIRMF